MQYIFNCRLAGELEMDTGAVHCKIDEKDTVWFEGAHYACSGLPVELYQVKFSSFKSAKLEIVIL